MRASRRVAIHRILICTVMALLATACNHQSASNGAGVSLVAPAAAASSAPRGADPPPAPSSVQPAPKKASTLDTLSVEQLLAAGHTAIVQHRLVAPSGDNAFAYFEAVLQKDPDNPVAATTLQDMYPYAASAVERTISDHEYEQARQQIALLAKADPDNYTLTILRAKLQGQAQAPQQSRTVADDGTLTLTASTGSWIDVSTTSGQTLYSGLLGAGEQRSFNNTGPLNVVVGNAAGVKATVDGKALPLKPGYHSKVARFRVFQH